MAKQQVQVDPKKLEQLRQLKAQREAATAAPESVVDEPVKELNWVVYKVTTGAKQFSFGTTVCLVDNDGYVAMPKNETWYRVLVESGALVPDDRKTSGSSKGEGQEA